MAAGMFSGHDPREVVPERYRPPEPKPREMTEHEREVAQEIGLQALGALFRQMKQDRG